MTSWPPGENRTVRSRLDDLGVNPVGAGLLLSGAVLLLAALTVLDWYRDGSGFFSGAGSHTTFDQIRRSMDVFDARVHATGTSGYFSYGAANTYFGWLGWALFLAALAVGVAAVTRFGQSWWVRWFGAVVCATGVAVTLLAIDLITVQGNAPNNADLPSFGQYFGQTGIGAWAAIVGYVLMLAGCLVPHRNA